MSDMQSVFLSAPTLAELKADTAKAKELFKSGWLRVIVNFDWLGSAGYIARIDNSPEKMIMPDGCNNEHNSLEFIA